MPKIPNAATKPAPAAPPAPAAKPEKQKPPTKVKHDDRPIIYPTKEGDDSPWTLEQWRALPPDERVQIVPCLGANALTAEQAKKLLGWQPVTHRDASTHFQDATGAWIRCLNNTHNRWFDDRFFRQFIQDVLNLNWAGTGNDPDETVNGETIIIGRSGEVLSGQKRLAALVVADQIYAGKGDIAGGKTDQSRYWKSICPTNPVLPCIVVFGVAETQRVVRTLDNVQPRNPADVFFLDPDLLGKYEPKDRLRLARMLDYATRLLWDRTGACDDPHNPARTNSEVVEFVNRHPRLLKCIKHIHEENQSGEGEAVSRFMSPGYASALLYLMAASDSDGNKYRNADSPSERQLDFGCWDKAREFWTLLAGNAQSVKEVWMAPRPLVGDKTEWGGYIFSRSDNKGSFAEKVCLLAKTWAVFKKGHKITEDDARLDYKEFERWEKNAVGVDPSLWGTIETAPVLAYPHPTFEGIDLEITKENEEDTDDPKEEIERRKAQEQKGKEQPKSAPSTKRTVTEVADELVANGKVPAKPAPKPIPKKSVKKTAKK